MYLEIRDFEKEWNKADNAVPCLSSAVICQSGVRHVRLRYVHGIYTDVKTVIAEAVDGKQQSLCTTK